MDIIGQLEVHFLQHWVPEMAVARPGDKASTFTHWPVVQIQDLLPLRDLPAAASRVLGCRHHCSHLPGLSTELTGATGNDERTDASTGKLGWGWRARARERGTISWETQPRGSATLRMGSLQGSHGRQHFLEEEPLLMLSANTTRLLRPGRPCHSGGSAALVSLTRLPLILSARSYRNILTPVSAPILFPRCS